MLKHLLFSFRILWRNKFTTIINVVGLAAGISSCLLIFLFVQNELSYDQHHRKKDRIFRVSTEMKLGNEITKFGLSSFNLSPTLKKDYPEVETSIRVMPVRKQTMWVDNQPFQFEENIMTDPEFFQVFDYDFVEGDPKTALKETDCVVITDEVAIRLFGSATGNLGKMIQYARKPYKLTGVVKDKKNASHLYFHTCLTISSITPQLRETLTTDWFYMMQTNYVLFKKEGNEIGFEKKLAHLRDAYIVPWVRSVNSDAYLTYHLQKLTDLHLDAEYETYMGEKGNATYLYIFGLVAVFILVIACINYLNMATATAIKRAKEIGIRKTAGAAFGQLFWQFIAESAVLSLLSILVALGAVLLLLPFFNHLADKSLQLPISPGIALVLLLFWVCTGFLAGLYPAILLARQKPLTVIKSQNLSVGRGSWVKQILVVIQFFISISFILGTMVVVSQMYFMKNADMGFDKEQLLVVTVPMADTSLAGKFDVLQHELGQHPQIRRICFSSQVPGQSQSTLIQSMQEPGRPRIEQAVNIMQVSHDFIPILGMKVVKGRNFDKSFGTDDTAAFVVNESFIKRFGFRDPFQVEIANGMGYEGKIVGIVRDFHYTTLKSQIEPLILVLGGKVQGALLIKLQPGNSEKTLAFVEQVWKKYSRKYPMEYFFLDENFQKLYRKEDKMAKIFMWFSALSIVLSCLGLFALITFSLEQKVKEVGIRKVLGASRWQILVTTSRHYVYLIFIAAALALPVSAYFLQEWLQSFAYRIELTWWMFVGSFLLVFAVAGLTLLAKILPASNANPVKSLRME